eukprot:IDg9558t1
MKDFDEYGRLSNLPISGKAYIKSLHLATKEGTHTANMRVSLVLSCWTVRLSSLLHRRVAWKSGERCRSEAEIDQCPRGVVVARSAGSKPYRAMRTTKERENHQKEDGR